MTSLAAVVIPVHDGARFLADALASVAEQDLDLEVVVVDDGSTDASAEIARDLGATCLRQAHLGPAAARNAGIAASSAPLVSLLDADDLIPPGALARQLEHLVTHPGSDGVMGMQEYRVVDGVALPDWAVADHVGEEGEVSRPSLAASVIRRSTFDRVGGFDPRLRFSEDVDWLMRANEAGAVIDVVADVVLVRRIHGANLTYDTDSLRRGMFEVLGARSPPEATRSVRRPGLDGSCWPDPGTEDVLRAALLPGPAAVEAWQRARASIDRRDDVLADRQRLLPLVLSTIGAEAAGDDAADMKRLHREVWRDNRLHLHHAPRWLDPLQGEVPVMLLKGMALAPRAYPDIGRRPMSDIDLLVPSPQIGHAVALLAAAGWIGAEGRPLPTSWQARHSAPLVHPDGGHIDLHHAPGVPFMGHTKDGVAVPEMWAGQRPTELVDRPVAVPAPEDLLLTVVVHGLTSVNGWSSRWVADAVLLLRSEEVDWDRFAERARRHHVVLPARSAMRYLVDTFDAPVPADALWDLWALPVSDGDRRRFDTVTGALGADHPWQRTSGARGRWARLRTALGPAAALVVPRLTADYLDVARARDVPAEVVRRARGRRARGAGTP